MWDIMATHCTVFPRPISSARIPFTPFSYSVWKAQHKHHVGQLKHPACTILKWCLKSTTHAPRRPTETSCSHHSQHLIGTTQALRRPSETSTELVVSDSIFNTWSTIKFTLGWSHICETTSQCLIHSSQHVTPKTGKQEELMSRWLAFETVYNKKKAAFNFFKLSYKLSSALGSPTLVQSWEAW